MKEVEETQSRNKPSSQHANHQNVVMMYQGDHIFDLIDLRQNQSKQTAGHTKQQFAPYIDQNNGKNAHTTR